jgi:prolyl-tRNA editing enzyme YbaK/EbsC (Cys-tRNA(Pro) deacylase)
VDDDAPDPLHRNSRRVVEEAARAGLSVAVTRFPEGTRTAADAARAVGCELGQIVKSIVLASDGGHVVVLTSGVNRVDYAKVAVALGVGGVRRADADGVRAATGFPIGGAAPWGHPAPLPVLCDRDLLDHDEVWAAAGTPDTVFPVAPGELVRVSGAVVADVAEGAVSG